MEKKRLSVGARQSRQSAGYVDPLDVIPIAANALEDIGDSGGAEPVCPSRVPALVDHDGEEPRSYGAAGSKLTQLSPRPRYCLLGRILGLPAVAQHRMGQPQGGFDQWPEQSLEGSFIAAQGLLEEGPIANCGQGMSHIIQDTPAPGLVTAARRRADSVE